jgi:hypothetical protein
MLQTEKKEDKCDNDKQQVVAILLAVFVGGIGVHDFYLE